MSLSAVEKLGNIMRGYRAGLRAKAFHFVRALRDAIRTRNKDTNSLENNAKCTNENGVTRNGQR